MCGAVAQRFQSLTERAAINPRPHAKEKNKLCLRDLALIFAQASGRLKKEKQGRPRMPRRLRRLRVRHILRLLHLSVVVVQLGVELGRGLEI